MRVWERVSSYTTTLAGEILPPQWVTIDYPLHSLLSYHSNQVRCHGSLLPAHTSHSAISQIEQIPTKIPQTLGPDHSNTMNTKTRILAALCTSPGYAVATPLPFFGGGEDKKHGCSMHWSELDQKCTENLQAHI